MQRKRTNVIVAVFVLALIAPGVGVAQDIRWIDNYREALAEANRTGKPIFLAFRCVP